LTQDASPLAKKQIHFSNKALLSLLIPLMIEQILAVAIGAADTLMITSAGEAALSAFRWWIRSILC